MKYYGQFETDKIIADYFVDQKTGSCIEVGAYDGIKGSNTKLFEDSGWFCLCIEPNPIIFQELRKNRLFCINCACSSPYKLNEKLNIITLKSGIQSSITSLKLDDRLVRDYGKDITNTKSVNIDCRTLDDIIEKSEIGYIDFISIDTEGTEIDVLHGLDLTKTRPELFVIENNYEDVCITDHMNKFGYKLDQRYNINDFYVKN